MSKTPSVRWTKHRFDQLSPHLLYAIIHLRNEVFVVEQNCVYQDADHQDQSGVHLCGFDEHGALLAYARILPRGSSYPDHPSLGRIIVAPQARGFNIGKSLIKKAVSECWSNFGGRAIRIGAQTYLLDFYQGLGFVKEGEEYLEDGIPHIKMLLTKV